MRKRPTKRNRKIIETNKIGEKLKLKQKYVTQFTTVLVDTYNIMRSVTNTQMHIIYALQKAEIISLEK